MMFENNNSRCRIHREILTGNFLGILRNISGDRVAESLLAYICWQYQFDVFQYGFLDPEKFANQMGYSLNYLRETLEEQLTFQAKDTPKERMPHPVSLRVRSKDEIRGDDYRCIKRIDNAFYLLSHRLVSIEGLRTVNTQYGKHLERHNTTYVILEYFAIVQNEISGKISYKYRLSEPFRLALNNYYLTFTLDSLVKLRRRGLSALYGHLVTVSRAVFAQGRTKTLLDSTPSFELLCNLGNIEYASPAERKKNLSKDLLAVDKLSNLHFDFEWVRGPNQKERYTIIFTFKPEVGDMPSTRFGQNSTIEARNNRVSIAVLEFTHNLIKACPIDYQSISRTTKEQFFEWLSDLNKKTDFEEIHCLLANSFVNAGLQIPKNIRERVEVFFRSANVLGENKFEEWMRQIFFDMSVGYKIDTASIQKVEK